MIDPKTYAEIVAKRPELAVPGLSFFSGDNCLDTEGGPCPPMWCIHDNGPFMHADEVIGWHWTRMLPPGYCLEQGVVDGWRVREIREFKMSGEVGIFPDPLSALTEFWRSQ